MLKSEILQTERTVWVARSQEALPDQKLPVLYILDGQTHFEMAASLVRYLSAFNTIPPFLVVGLDNSQERERDLTPYQSNMSPNGGGAARYYQYVTQEILPWVNRHYSTSGFQALAGKSYGGMFALFAAQQQDCPFQAVISVSPSLFLADNQMLKDVSDHVEQVAQRRFLFLSHATEDDIMRIPFLQLSGFLAAHAQHRFHHHIYEAETHESTFQPALFDALKSLFDQWQVPRYVTQTDPQAVVQHYDRLISELDLRIQIPFEALKRTGRLMQSSGFVEAARDVFLETIRRYPDSGYAEYFLAKALLKLGQSESALAHMQLAVTKSKAAGDSDWQAMQEELTEIQNSISK